MDPTEKGPAKFYELFKVHKKHVEGKTPPERPIISGSGSVTENIGVFVEHNIKELANKHSTFLQDTPDFLRNIEELNNKENYLMSLYLFPLMSLAFIQTFPKRKDLMQLRKLLNRKIT